MMKEIQKRLESGLSWAMSFGLVHKLLIKVIIEKVKKLENGIFYIGRIKENNLYRCKYENEFSEEVDLMMRKIQKKLEGGLSWVISMGVFMVKSLIMVNI